MTSAASRPVAISTVVFDLGGVLIDWDPAHLLARDDIAALDIDGVQRELDLGTPVEQVRARWHELHPSRTADVDRYFDEWHRTLGGPMDDVVEILADVRGSGVRLYVLSNFSGELFRQARHRFGFLEWFDGLLISGDEGVIKPDAAIYELLLERYGLTAARTVFIDDREENIAGARAAGLHGIHFRTAGALRGELGALDVL